MLKKFVTHMRYHTPSLGVYRSARLAAALTYGELRDRVSPKHRQARQKRLEFDKRYNVSTTDRRFVADMVGTANETPSLESIRYEPIEVVHVEEALGILPIDFSKFTLIDIGVGKGKVLFIAANRPFAKLVGVEFDTTLAEIASANVKSHTNPDQQCDQIEIVNADARDFELKDLPAVLYFYFPFRAALLQEVLDHYGAALRQCYLIWTTLEDAEAAVLSACPHLEEFGRTEESVIFRGTDLAD